MNRLEFLRMGEMVDDLLAETQRALERGDKAEMVALRAKLVVARNQLEEYVRSTMQ